MEDFIRKLHQTNNKFNKIQKFIFNIIILSIFSVVLETEITIYTAYAEVFYYLNYFFAFFFLFLEATSKKVVLPACELNSAELE